MAQEFLPPRRFGARSERVEAAWSKPYWRLRIPSEERAFYRDLVASLAQTTEIVTPVNKAATHWHDDLVLATAIDGKADFVVTGDREFLRLTSFQGIEIVSPATFLVRLDEELSGLG